MKKNSILKHLQAFRPGPIPRRLAVLMTFLLLVSFFSRAQDSKVTPNVTMNTNWVNGGVFGSSVAAADPSNTWVNEANIVNSNTGDYGHVVIPRNVATTSGDLSIKDGQTYGSTPFTGYYVGAVLVTNTTGLSVFTANSITLTTYIGGVSTGETYTTGSTGNIGFYVHKPFDELRISVSGTASGFTGGGEIRVNNVFLRRYTRLQPCNSPEALLGPGLDATLANLSVGLWSPAAEGNLEDSDVNSHASYAAVLGTGIYTASVKDLAVVYPAGTFGGFTFQSTSILGGDLINASTITLRKNGVDVISETGASLLAGSILNTDGTVTIGLVSTADFDEVFYSNTGVGLAVGQGINLYYPTIKAFCNNPISNLACNTKAYLHEGDGTNPNYPVYTTSAKASIACLECSVDLPNNVIDNDPGNYATISQLVAGASTMFLGVKSQETGGYPAGTYVGFELEDVNVASFGAAIGHVVTTYMNGVVVDTYSDVDAVAGKYFNTTGKHLVGFKANGAFNEVRITINSLGAIGIYSTRIYNAVIERFCTTYEETCNAVTPLVRDGYPVYVDGANTGITSVASANNVINNTDRLIDSDLTNYASIVTVASGAASATVAVQDGGNTYPAGTFAGFDFSNPSFASISSLSSIKIQTLDASGAVVETVTAGANLVSLSSSLSSGTGRQTVGFLATLPFTGVKLTIEKATGVDLGEVRVYAAVIQQFCIGETLVCGTLTPATNPDYPVYVDGKQTGFFGLASAGNGISNSQNVLDGDAASYASITLGAAIGTSASFAVANAKETYPAETYAGFDIGSMSLFNAGVLSSMSITLYNNGVAVQNSAGTALLGGITSSLITDGYNRDVVGVVGHVPFDEVKITFTNGASVDLGTIRIYSAVFQPFLNADGTQYCPAVIECQSSYVLTNSTTGGKTVSAVVNYEHTGVTGVGAAGYEIANPWNVVSADITDFATIYNTASGASQASLSVATPNVVYPAGTFAGFTIKKNPSILAAALFPQITITTYLKGHLQESNAGGALADFTLFTQWFGTPTDFYNPGFKATLPFDEITITVASLASLSDHKVDVYGAYVDTRESTPAPGDGSTAIACPYPDLTPILFVSPTNITGTKPVSIVVDVYNIPEIDTPTVGSPIRVYLTKDNKINLAFDPAATITGSKQVQNSVWTFDGTSNPDYYIFTTSTVIDGFDSRSFGLTGTFNPGATSGTLTISTTIEAGSGGEINDANNEDAESIKFYKN